MEESSRFKRLSFILMCKLFKQEIYVMRDELGQVVGCASFGPNLSVSARPLLIEMGEVSLWKTLFVSLPKFLLSIRRTKRAEIGVIGFTPEVRGRGLVKLIDNVLESIMRSGYKELDTGPIWAENKPVMKMASYLERKYGVEVQHMRYYTLVYRF